MTWTGSGYTLTLCCDAADSLHGHASRAQFTGNCHADAQRKAEAAGWNVGWWKLGKKCRCPAHARKRKGTKT